MDNIFDRICKINSDTLSYIKKFSLYIKELFFFFFSERLPASPYKFELLGLDLLCLLSQNKVGEFHTALEHLDPSVVRDNVYIRHPVSMEQYLMEGAYNKVYNHFRY